jgi:trimeric autotransporter adhesin
LSFDDTGNLLICHSNHVRKVNKITHIITNIAGCDTATLGVSDDYGNGGLATTVQVQSPDDVCVDETGNFYIVDLIASEIRKVSLVSGIITRYAGDGVDGFSGDGGPADSAELGNIESDCIDTIRKYLYISDEYSYRIRRVNMLTGIIETVAGTGVSGYNGDGILADTAKLSRTLGIRVNDAGDLYICDWDNERIRRVDAETGIITTVVGNGIAGFSGDGGPATDAMINTPAFLCFDKCDNLYFSDQANQRVRKVDALSGIITTVAGNGTGGFSGDGGPAIDAEIHVPEGVAVDDSGNLFISDYENFRVRKVTQVSNRDTATISLTTSDSAYIGDSAHVTASLTNAGGSYTIIWRKNGVVFDTTTTPSVNYIKGSGTDAITATVIPQYLQCNDSSLSNTVLIKGVKNEGVGNIVLNGISLYPNPVKNKLTITAQDAINNVNIFNTIWQEMYNREYSSTNVIINTAALPPGVYFVRVNGVFTAKVVKE